MKWQCSINVYCTAGHIAMWAVQYCTLLHRTENYSWPNMTWIKYITTETPQRVGVCMCIDTCMVVTVCLWSSPSPHCNKVWNWVAWCVEACEKKRVCVSCGQLIGYYQEYMSDSVFLSVLSWSLHLQSPSDDLQHIPAWQQLPWRIDRVSHESTQLHSWEKHKRRQRKEKWGREERKKTKTGGTWQEETGKEKCV